MKRGTPLRPSPMPPRKSPLSRSGELSSGSGPKRTQMKRSRKRPMGQRELGLACAFHDAALAQGKCAACPYDGPFVEAHHAIPKSFIKRTLGKGCRPEAVWATANAVLLCRDCHAAHTGASTRLTLDVLPAAVWEFCAELDELVPGAPFTERLHREYRPVERARRGVTLSNERKASR